MLKLLDENGLAENTIVIFFSDNGGSGGADNAPLRGHKGLVFEGGVRVCCLVRYPAKIPAGSVNGEFLTSLEWLPTLLNLAGIAPPEGLVLDGFDILPVLAEGKPSPRAAKCTGSDGRREAARVGQWKWVRNAGQVSLFNLAEDVAEKNDLAAGRGAGRAREMQTRFENWLAEMDAAEPRGPFKDF